jgi:hypothetical protein
MESKLRQVWSTGKVLVTVINKEIVGIRLHDVEWMLLP